MWEWNEDIVGRLVNSPHAKERDESVRFMRGLVVGSLISSVIWGVLVYALINL